MGYAQSLHRFRAQRDSCDKFLIRIPESCHLEKNHAPFPHLNHHLPHIAQLRSIWVEAMNRAEQTTDGGVRVYQLTTDSQPSYCLVGSDFLRTDSWVRESRTQCFREGFRTQEICRVSTRKIGDFQTEQPCQGHDRVMRHAVL
jgi:hypothetical protein